METTQNETTSDPVAIALAAQAETTKVEAEKLYVDLLAAEKAMEPYKVAYEAARSKWAQVYNANRTLTQLLAQREGK
jgi:hypothetical protein